MAEELLLQIRQRLQKRFPQIKNYGEYVGRGFQRPGLFAEVKGISFRRGIGNRYRLRVNLAVSYYDNERNEDGTADRNGRLHSMAMSLYDIMEMEGMLSLEMSHHIDEGVLVFEASYVFYVEKAQEDTGALMNKMNLEME